MPNLRTEDHESTKAWLANLETKVGPTVNSAFGLNNWGSADAATPSPADAPTWLNVVVAACLGWLDRSFPMADLEIRKVDSKDVLGDVIHNHPFMDLMDRPNPIDTFHSFWQSFLISDVCDGNTFFAKVRDRGQRIHSLWWVPPWDVEVVGSPTKDAAAPVAGYWCVVEGMKKWYEPNEVVHIKDGKDPINHLRGLSKLKAGLRSVATIDRAELYTQTLMRNCGAIPMLVSPSDPAEQIDPSNVALLRGQFGEMTTGYNNGKPFISPQGLRVDRLGITPEELTLDKIREFPIAAICALIGTPAMVTGLPDPGKTYSNLQQAEYIAWNNGMIPRQDRAAEAMDKQCPELIHQTAERLVWNRSRVIALHAPVLERLDSLGKAAGGPILTPDEARKFIDLGSVPGGDSIRALTGPTPQPDASNPGAVPIAGDVQATALNGAQVTSLVEIANAVATGTLPPESARALIAASFPNLTTDQVSAIVGPLIAFEPTTPPPPAATAKPAFPPSGKSLEREDDIDPFPLTAETKDDMPPRVGAGAEDPNQGQGEENTYGLPTGKPIEDELLRWFKLQMMAVLGQLPPAMADVPESFPSLADYDEPMSRAMTPILAVYWQESGDKTVGELRAATGLDLDAWTVVNPHTQKKIEDAAFAFCESTNKTTHLNLNTALDRLRAEMVAGVAVEGDTLAQLRKRVQSVFTDAEKWRAQRIATTEASRAVHLAQEQAAIESDVVQGFKWLLSANACPLCHRIADEVKQVKIGQPFAVIGDNPNYAEVRMAPAHPGCRCSVTHVLMPEYGGPESPKWGETVKE